MSGYGDVKTRKIINVLKWLSSKKGVEVVLGGKHPTKVKCIHNGNAFPLPTSHRIINKHIVKAFIEFLLENDICTKDEFDGRL